MTKPELKTKHKAEEDKIEARVRAMHGKTGADHMEADIIGNTMEARKEKVEAAAIPRAGTIPRGGIIPRAGTIHRAGTLPRSQKTKKKSSKTK